MHLFGGFGIKTVFVAKHADEQPHLMKANNTALGPPGKDAKEEEQSCLMTTANVAPGPSEKDAEEEEQPPPVMANYPVLCPLGEGPAEAGQPGKGAVGKGQLEKDATEEEQRL